MVIESQLQFLSAAEMLQGRHQEMDSKFTDFVAEHLKLTRRFFLHCGTAGIAAACALPDFSNADEPNPEWKSVLDQLEPWLTKQDDFRDVSRGNPKPHSLDDATRKSVGLTRESWQLEVAADPESNTRIGDPMTRKNNTAFTFQDLMKLAEKRKVRFPKVMTCLNLGRPLGNGIWEGVPLRDVLWLTQPTQNLRRVFFYGYHNDDPKQMFRSSLPVGRVLEDPFGLPPVIICYKLNDQWLTPERGAPVRIVVPEAYGFKSIKWLTHVFLTNQWKSNDTYGEQNNDVDSPLKTFCGTISVPKTVKPNQPIAVTGYAQVGISGLKKVQTWIHDNSEDVPGDDKYFTKAPWSDATILSPPKSWGGDLVNDRIPVPTRDFDPKTGQPNNWPIRLTKAHWATLIPGLPPGEYTLRCRTIDENGNAQPMPRPFRKSGRAAIEKFKIIVKA